MRWIKTNTAYLINLEQISSIYVEERWHVGGPTEYNVVYLLPSGNTLEEHFDTEQAAKDRLKALEHDVGVAKPWEDILELTC